MHATPWEHRLYSLGLTRRDELNRAFGGGLPKGSIVLVEGDHGVGKSTLAGRFAYGLTEQSHEVTYLSTERPVGPFLAQMRSLSYDMTRKLITRQLLYLFGDLSVSDGDGDAPQLLSRLISSPRLWESDVAIIDTIGDVLRHDPAFDGPSDQAGRRSAVQRLVSFLRGITRGGRTVVLAIHPSGLADETLASFRTSADVVLRLDAAPRNSRVDRRIDIERSVGMRHGIADSIPFFIRSGVGIVVDNRRVI